MSKSIRFKNNIYVDSTRIMCKKQNGTRVSLRNLEATLPYTSLQNGTILPNSSINIDLGADLYGLVLIRIWKSNVEHHRIYATTFNNRWAHSEQLLTSFKSTTGGDSDIYFGVNTVDTSNIGALAILTNKSAYNMSYWISVLKV